MASLDRLTTLITRFHLSVRQSPVSDASLLVTAARDGAPKTVFFRTTKCHLEIPTDRVLFSAIVEWGGRVNPLITALPDVVELDLSKDPESQSLVRLIEAEVSAQRCGSSSVISRFGEILIVRMLRAQIEAGSTRVGLLAGLSDPRLSRAIVAIHDQPGRNWRNADLAQIAGLSLSRFAEMFLSIVGEPPASYLRRWRLTLARQDAVRGDRVDSIARRYGYESPEGFARAFKKQFGENPISLRPTSALKPQPKSSEAKSGSAPHSARA